MQFLQHNQSAITLEIIAHYQAGFQDEIKIADENIMIRIRQIQL